MSAEGSLQTNAEQGEATKDIDDAYTLRKGTDGKRFARLWLEDPRVMPPSSKLLGCRPIEADPERGFCRNAFTLKPEFYNPLGVLQGGFIAAMLDDTMAVGSLFKIGGGYVVPTLEMKVSYQKAVSGKEAFAEGWLVHAGRTIAFLEGQLIDEAGDVCARASATALIREFRKR